jgi:regulator of protease activity HflC (stomatin/prohibitin superfamily)
MASEPVHIHDDSELPGLIERAADQPVRFERKGIVYQLRAETEAQGARTYDPDALRKAIGDVQGLFTDEEADDMIEKVYEYRRLGSRPATRP